LSERTRAATPATCGVAIEVPDLFEYVLSQSVLRMPTPGATTSICGPVFENDARRSSSSVAPTAKTLGYAAG
jgi:hypothetical protein